MTERFELLTKLGQGTMGAVWKVRDTVTGDVLAMKLLHPHLASRSELVQRFEREVEISRRISSPNVVEVLGYGKRQGAPFLAMEFVEGVSLKDHIQSRGPLPLSEALPLFRQIMQGLIAAHAGGIVHRDLKPTNVMIDSQGVAKLLDFGVARAQDVTRLTGANQTFGTPFYMSPEGQEDERSDLYSAGCLLFEMLTGRPPFQGETAHEVVLKHLRDTVDLTLLQPEARGLVNWMMQKEPQRRPGSAMELMKAVDGEMQVPAHANPPVAPVPQVTRPAPAPIAQTRPQQPAVQPPQQPRAQPPVVQAPQQPPVQQQTRPQQPAFDDRTEYARPQQPVADDRTEIARPQQGGGAPSADPFRQATQPLGSQPPTAQPFQQPAQQPRGGGAGPFPQGAPADPTIAAFPGGQGARPDPFQGRPDPFGGAGRQPQPDPFRSAAAQGGAPVPQQAFGSQPQGQSGPFGGQPQGQSGPFGASGIPDAGVLRIRSQAQTPERNPLFSIFAAGGGIVILIAFFVIPALTFPGGRTNLLDYIDGTTSAASDDAALYLAYAWWLIPVAGLAAATLGILGAASQGGVSGGLARLTLLVAVVALAANFAGFLGVRIAVDGAEPEPLLIPITGLWEDFPAWPVFTLGAVLIGIGAIIGMGSAGNQAPGRRR